MWLIAFTWANAQRPQRDNLGNIASGAEAAEDTGTGVILGCPVMLSLRLHGFQENLDSQGWQATLSLGVVSTTLTLPISHLSEYAVFYYNLLQFFKQLT